MSRASIFLPPQFAVANETTDAREKTSTRRQGILIGGTMVYNDDIPIHELDKLFASENARYIEEEEGRDDAHPGDRNLTKGGPNQLQTKQPNGSIARNGRSLRTSFVTPGETSLKAKVRLLRVKKSQRPRRMVVITEQDDNTVAKDIASTLNAESKLIAESPFGMRNSLARESSGGRSPVKSSGASPKKSPSKQALPSSSPCSPSLGDDSTPPTLVEPPSGIVSPPSSVGQSVLANISDDALNGDGGKIDIEIDDFATERELRAKRRLDLLMKLEQHQTVVDTAHAVRTGQSPRALSVSVDEVSSSPRYSTASQMLEFETCDEDEKSTNHRVTSGDTEVVDAMTMSSDASESVATNRSTISNDSEAVVLGNHVVEAPEDVGSGGVEHFLDKEIVAPDLTSARRSEHEQEVSTKIMESQGIGEVSEVAEFEGKGESEGDGISPVSLKETIVLHKQQAEGQPQSILAPGGDLSSIQKKSEMKIDVLLQNAAKPIEFCEDSSGATGDPRALETADTDSSAPSSPSRRSTSTALRKSRWGSTPSGAHVVDPSITTECVSSSQGAVSKNGSPAPSQVSSSPANSSIIESFQNSSSVSSSANSRQLSVAQMQRMMSVDGTEISSMYSGDDHIGFMGGRGGVLPRRDESLEEAARFAVASSKQGLKSPVPSYTGAIDFEHLSVTDNLEMYFKEQVFGLNRPSGLAPYMRYEVAPQRPVSTRDDGDIYVEAPAKPESIVAFFREKTLELESSTVRRAVYAANVEGESDIVKRVFVLTDINLYVVLDNFASVHMFADAPLPVLHRRHAIETLR